MSLDGLVNPKFERLAHRGGRSAWELSHAITGSAREAEEVLGAVLSHTIPRVLSSSEEVFRSELLISAGEVAALAVYSPFDNGSQSRANNGTRRPARGDVDPGVLWLESAFRRRVPWYLQTLLWAVEVERLPGPPMEKRLSLPRHSDQRAHEVLIRAFMDSASQVAPERACLQRVWAACRSGRTKRSMARHAATCEWCAAQLEILLNLGESLPKLATPMPESVWTEAWEPVQQTIAQGQPEQLVTPGLHAGGTTKRSSQTGRKGAIVTAALLMGVTLALILGLRGARLTTELAGGAPQVPLSTSNGGSISVAPAFTALPGRAIEPTALREAALRASNTGATSSTSGSGIQSTATSASSNTTGATSGSSAPAGTSADGSGSSGGLTSTPSGTSPGSPGRNQGSGGASESAAVGPATASVATDPNQACGTATVSGGGPGVCLGVPEPPWYLVEFQPGTPSATSGLPSGPAPIGIGVTAPAAVGGTALNGQGATSADGSDAGGTSSGG